MGEVGSLLHANYRQTQMVTGERKMANGLLLHANYRQTQMMTGERMMANGLSAQVAGADVTFIPLCPQPL